MGYIPTPTLNVLKDVADRTVAAIAEAEFYAAVTVAGFRKDRNQVERAWVSSEGSPRVRLDRLLERGVQPRQITFVLPRKGRPMHLEGYAALVPLLPPSAAIAVQTDALHNRYCDWDDVSPAFNQMTELTLELDAEVSLAALPPQLRHLTINARTPLAWTLIKDRGVFPIGLESLALIGDPCWFPATHFHRLPSRLKKLELASVRVYGEGLVNTEDWRNGEEELFAMNDSVPLTPLLEVLLLSCVNLETFERLSLPASLKRLELRDMELALFDLSGFPHGLRELSFKAITVPHPWLERLEFPLGLQKMSLSQCLWKRVLFLNHLPPSLKELDLSGCELERNNFLEPPPILETPFVRFPKGISTLNLDRCEGVFDQCLALTLWFPEGLVTLSLAQNGLRNLDGFVFPSLLQNLNLGQNNLAAIPQNLPALLREVNLGGNNLKGTLENLPPFKQTRLFSQHWTKIEITLPPTLEQLCLCAPSLRQLKILNGKSLALSLTLLELSMVGKIPLQEIPLPHSLRALWANFMALRSLEGVVFPPGLRILDLGHNRIQSLEGAVFPKTLTHLNLYFNALRSVDGIHFPPALESLTLTMNHIQRVRVLALPPSLQELRMANQRPELKEFNCNLPSGLKHLNLRKCSLPELTLRQLCYPASFASLNAYDPALRYRQKFREWVARHLLRVALNETDPWDYHIIPPLLVRG